MRANSDAGRRRERKKKVGDQEKDLEVGEVGDRGAREEERSNLHAYVGGFLPPLSLSRPWVLLSL